MADLTGKTIANTYKDLLQTGTSGTGLPQDAPVAVQDGEGKSSGLLLSQNQIDLTGTVKIKGTELTANVSALNAVADFTAVSGFAAGDGIGNITGRTFSASTGMSITNADGISGNPTFSLAQSGVTSGTYSGQTGLFDVDNTGRITAVNTTDTVSVGNVNTVNLSATTADFSGNVSIGGTLTMSGAISPSSVSTTGDVNGVNFHASGDISATALNVGGTVSAVDYYGDGSNLTGIVATSATNASYAASAGEAQTAVSASHAVSADFAASANNATFASTATNASFAASATNATNATSAVFASSATNATNAINVDYGGVVETSTANIGSVSASNIFVNGNVSVGGTFDVSGAVSIGGGLFVVGDVSAGNIHAGGIIYGNGAGLFNVPSESGGTVNFVKAGDGLHVLIDGTTTTNPISASGTVALDFDQTFGAVSASSLAISSSASFADSAVLNFGNSDDLTIQHNGTHSVIKEAGTGDLYIQSNRIRLANTGASDMLTLADGQDAEFPFGVQVSGTVSATSFVGPTITSINNNIASVSATTSVNAASITALSATMATSIANHLPLAGGTMTGTLTLNGSPSANLEAATKQYVDNLTAAAIHFHEAVRVESPDTAGNLNATYDNGTAGVGATLTNAGTQAALVIDGVTMVVNDRVLIYNQTDQTENGVYTVTNVGSASTNWVLTRATDADSYEPNDNTGLDGGSYFYVEEGNTGAGEAYVCNNVGEIVFGTTNITFTLFSSALVYTAGSGINISGSRVVSTSGVPTDADLTALSATMATSINNTNTNLTALSATMATSIANVSSTMATSIDNQASAITALSATMATSINNRTTAITALSATMAASIASRTSAITALSATMASSIANQATDSRVDALSATMATSINNRTTAITALSATMATSIANQATDSRVDSLSATLATSINNRTTAITALSATMASSIANQATDSRVDALSATLATSIGNQMPKSGGTFTGNITLGSNAINDVEDIYLRDRIYHDGDTDTYLQFHSGNQFRIVTGGTEMLEVNNDYVLLGSNTVGKVHTDTSQSGTQTPNFYVYNSFVWTLTGNLTLGNPSTEVAGMSGVFIFIQDGTGSRTISLSSQYETAGAAGLTLSTAANSVDIVPYFVQSSGNILLGTPQLAFS